MNPSIGDKLQARGGDLGASSRLSYKREMAGPSRGIGIGELARRSGVAVANIRYYEDIGLLPRPARSPGGQRSYDGDDLKRLETLKHYRGLGFSLAQTRQLLDLARAPDRPCAEARDLAASRLAALRSQIAAFAALEAELAGKVAQCDSGCLGGPAPDCCLVEKPPAPKARRAAPP